jgi:hypothetical protein
VHSSIFWDIMLCKLLKFNPNYVVLYPLLWEAKVYIKVKNVSNNQTKESICTRIVTLCIRFWSCYLLMPFPGTEVLEWFTPYNTITLFQILLSSCI